MEKAGLTSAVFVGPGWAYSPSTTHAPARPQHCVVYQYISELTLTSRQHHGAGCCSRRRAQARSTWYVPGDSLAQQNAQKEVLRRDGRFGQRAGGLAICTRELDETVGPDNRRTAATRVTISIGPGSNTSSSIYSICSARSRSAFRSMSREEPVRLRIWSGCSVICGLTDGW